MRSSPGPRNVLPAGGTRASNGHCDASVLQRATLFSYTLSKPREVAWPSAQPRELSGPSKPAESWSTVDSPSQAPSIKDPALFEAPGQADPEDGEASGFVVEAGTPSERMEGLIRATQMLVIGAIEVPANLPRLIAGLRCALGRRTMGKLKIPTGEAKRYCGGADLRQDRFDACGYRQWDGRHVCEAAEQAYRWLIGPVGFGNRSRMAV